MRYPYCVKANGRYYAPNEDIIETNGEVDSKREQAPDNRPDAKAKGRRGNKKD